jgi:hypothetical protein
MSHDVKIGFACAGTPTPAVARFGTAYVLSIGSRPILSESRVSKPWTGGHGQRRRRARKYSTEDDPVSRCMFNPREAGALAAHTGAARLVLAHLSAKQAALENRETLHAAVRDGGYAGECVVAEEGMWMPV